MPRKKQTATEQVNQRINAQTAKILGRYNLEKDPEERLRIKYEYVKALRKAFTLEILSLREKDWAIIPKRLDQALGRVG